MSERAHLYFDGGCGPCTLWAHAFRGLSGGSIVIAPIGSREGTRALGDLPEETRFSAFHLVVEGRRSTGEEALPSLLGLTFGRAVGRLMQGRNPLHGAVDRLYLALWEERRRHGCGAATR